MLYDLRFSDIQLIYIQITYALFLFGNVNLGRVKLQVAILPELKSSWFAYCLHLWVVITSKHLETYYIKGQYLQYLIRFKESRIKVNDQK